MNRIPLLENPGILKLLYFLHQNPGVHKLHAIPSRAGIGVGTTYRAAAKAALMGLVYLYYCGNTKCVELTEKGQKVAELIAKAVELCSTCDDRVGEVVVSEPEPVLVGT